MGQLIDLTGKTFGRWLVIERRGDIKGAAAWLCRCTCKTERVVGGQSLRLGTSTSCGCYHSENQSRLRTKHGASFTPEYTAWAHMMQRCLNPDNPEYSNYGARGITVCQRWQTAANFIADMGQRPSPKHTLERVNNDKGYSPENCIWDTQKNQCRNKRTNRPITWNNKTQLITDWSRELGGAKHSLSTRLSRGWSLERAMTTPF